MIERSSFNINKIGNLPKHDINYLMNASFEILTEDFDKTLNDFIVFEDGDNVVQIPKGTGRRSSAIDKIINYFITLEEYEKCAILKNLKDKIIEFGD